MSIVSGTAGAILGSNAQKDATRANLRAARETNAMNYRMFQEGRGASGSAFLPLYFGDQEKKIAEDATAFYNSSRNLLGTPEEQMGRYSAVTGRYMPMAESAAGALSDVFNGNLTENRLQFLQPVTEARTAVAKTQQQGVLEGLQARINAINAASKKAGHSGSGSFAQNRLLQATVPMRQAAAGVEAEAALANAADVRGVRDSGAQMKLQYMDMPFKQAQQALNLEMMPLNQVQQNFSRSLQPFDFFRMGPQGFRADPLPMVGADTTWPAIMNSVGNFNQGLAQMYMMGAFGGGGSGAGATGGWGGSNWAGSMA